MTQEHHLTIEGHHLVALEYNRHLDTIPVIFIHGIANSVYLWDLIQVPYIDNYVHWFSLSLPGHYPASLPENFRAKELTPKMIAEVMSEAVHQLTKGRPTLLIGYSTGAYAALCIAHHAPQLIKSMLLLDGFAKGVFGAGLRMPQIIANLKGIGSTIFKPYVSLATLSLMITRFAYNLVGTDLKAIAAHPNIDRVVKSNWETIQAGNLIQLYPYFRHLFHQDIGHWLSEINTDTLILHGDRDRVLIPAHAEYLYENLKNSQLKWIAGSGHLPFLERPAQYEQYITEWLQE